MKELMLSLFVQEILDMHTNPHHTFQGLLKFKVSQHVNALKPLRKGEGAILYVSGVIPNKDDNERAKHSTKTIPSITV